MKSLKPMVIRCEVLPGAYLDDCVREAVVLAVEQGCNVEFMHSARVFRVFVNDVLASVKATAPGEPREHK